MSRSRRRSACSSSANGAAMAMHFVDQLRDVFRRRELRNAVAEIEDVARMIAETVEHGAGFDANRRGRREQYRRIDVALQCPPATAPLARLGKVHRPVEANRVDPSRRDFLEPQAAALRE